MKIRRKSEKTTGVGGVLPLHTLITCTYQKLFKKDGGGMVLGGPNNGAAPEANAVHGGGNGTSDTKSHRHERGTSWRVVPEASRETPWGGAHEASRRRQLCLHHGDEGPDDDSPPTTTATTMAQGEDLHEVRTNPILPKRRKVKTTRYVEFSDRFADEVVPVTPPSAKAEKRSRNIEKVTFPGNVAPFTDSTTATTSNTAGANSKEDLIASIFYVFDTLGKSGLTASEVVALMLEQTLPGLKEGGARHTVQVANVLRRSRHFLSIGNKQYLPCSVSTEPRNSSGSSRKHGRHGQGGGNSHSHSSRSRSKPPPPVCKLYDGSGWFCPREAQTGSSLCAHHLNSIISRSSSSPLHSSLQTQSRSQSQALAQAPLSMRLRHDSKTRSLQDSPPRLPTSSFEDLGSAGDADSDSDRDDSDDMTGPALAKWGRDRTPPNQKRKMLSLCSIK